MVTFQLADADPWKQTNEQTKQWNIKRNKPNSILLYAVEKPSKMYSNKVTDVAVATGTYISTMPKFPWLLVHKFHPK